MSTNCSDSIRASKMRALRASKKSILYDDCPDSNNMSHRSISLSALSHGTAPTQTTIEPRISQLETLEARMASIEVSLSTTARRKSGKKSLNGSISGKPPTPVPSVTKSSVAETCKELEILRHVLRDKENTIQNLQGQVVSPKPLDAQERRAAELKMQQLRLEDDMRRGNIVRITEALKQINADDNNIDMRIRQAELEYELGREELALLGVREEKRALQSRLDTKPSPTLYSSLQSAGKVVMHALSVVCDPKSPKFGAGNLDNVPGLWVLWAAEESGLKKGDRILEVNGKLTLATTKDELNRLLSVCPTQAELVVWRPWAPTPSPADQLLRRENLRLTHRISYLEDQVADLLNFKEKTLTPQVEVFQKGSQVTVLSSPEPSRTRSRPGTEMQSDSDTSWRAAETVGPSQQYQDFELRKHKGSPSGAVSTVYIQTHSLSDLEGKKASRHFENERHRDRSVKSLDLDADTPKTKPQPPKKPLRLSMQRASSLQSMPLGGRRGKQKTVVPPPPVDPPDASYAALRWHFSKNRKGRTVHIGEKWC